MSDSPTPPRVAGTPEPEASADNDPELAALLNFEPVPRQVKRPKGWSPERQRRFLELIVQTGSPQRAAAAMKMKLSGVEQVYRDDETGSFRAAWDGICELVRTREEKRLKALNGGGIVEPPHRRSAQAHAHPHPGPLPKGEGAGGEGEEDEAYRRRVADARDSVSARLIRCRRLFLMSICNKPVKRAAFEILTELPVDWKRARAMEPQADEPWRKPNMRDADVLLTAENGWMGEFLHGPDKKAELLRQLNEWRVKQGQAPITG